MIISVEKHERAFDIPQQKIYRTNKGVFHVDFGDHTHNYFTGIQQKPSLTHEQADPGALELKEKRSVCRSQHSLLQRSRQPLGRQHTVALLKILKTHTHSMLSVWLSAAHLRVQPKRINQSPLVFPSAHWPVK